VVNPYIRFLKCEDSAYLYWVLTENQRRSLAFMGSSWQYLGTTISGILCFSRTKLPIQIYEPQASFLDILL